MGDIGDAVREGLTSFGDARVVRGYGDWAQIRTDLIMPSGGGLEIYIEADGEGWRLDDGGWAWQYLIDEGIEGVGWHSEEEEARARALTLALVDDVLSCCEGVYRRPDGASVARDDGTVSLRIDVAAGDIGRGCGLLASAAISIAALAYPYRAGLLKAPLEWDRGEPGSRAQWRATCE